MVQNVVLVFLRRRLSQRPNVEELESRNILKRKFRKYPPKRVFNLQRDFSLFLNKLFCAFKSKKSKKRTVAHW